MPELRTRGIEEQVMRSAGALLYGHASAWDVHRSGRSRRAPDRRILPVRRVGVVTAGMRLVRRRPAVVVASRPWS